MANGNSHPKEWAEILYLSNLKEHTDAQEVRIKELSEIFKPTRSKSKRDRPENTDKPKKLERSKKKVIVIEPDSRERIFNNVPECADFYSISPGTLYARLAKISAHERGKLKGFRFSYYEGETDGK